MNLKIGFISLVTFAVLCIGLSKCHRERVDITNFEAVKQCSHTITIQGQYVEDPSLLFKVIYGDYVFEDSTEIVINPNGMVFYMKDISGHRSEILYSDTMRLEIDAEGKLFAITEDTILHNDEIVICDGVIGYVGSKKLGQLTCKCTL